jgi:hypothetical protein
VLDQLHATDHHHRGDERADRRALADDERDRDAREHAVRERVAEEGETAQHDPGSDHAGAQHAEQGRPQRVAHERVVGERCDPPVDGVEEPVHAVIISGRTRHGAESAVAIVVAFDRMSSM